MQLTEFNQASDSDIELLLKQCVHIDRWAEELKQQRPFTSRDELLEAAKRQAQTWTWEEISKALATHPRIGEKQAQTALTAKEEGFSEREQATISQNEESQAALLKGNLAYEKKFDFIFLIRAAGRSSEEILTALNYRLVNDLDTEKRIVHQQLLEIALLRLAQEIDS